MYFINILTLQVTFKNILSIISYIRALTAQLFLRMMGILCVCITLEHMCGVDMSVFLWDVSSLFSYTVSLVSLWCIQLLEWQMGPYQPVNLLWMLFKNFSAYNPIPAVNRFESLRYFQNISCTPVRQAIIPLHCTVRQETLCYKGWIYIVGVSMAYNFKTGSNKIKLLTEYENVTQKFFFCNAELAALMSGRKYNVIVQNGDCSRESNVRTSVFRNKFRYKDASSFQNSI
jgi:hypothetical protein